MINPDVVRYGIEAVGMALPAFAIGAAIFRISREASANPGVKTVELGRNDVFARTEVGGEGETYVGIPTGARVDIRLGGSSMLQVLDMRKKESRPDLTPKLLIEKGAYKRDLVHPAGWIEDHEIHSVEGIKREVVEVRYLGSIHNRVLQNNLKTLFEQGAEQSHED